MRINFDTVLLDLKGNPIKDGGNDDLTLSAACCASLLTGYPDEQGLSAKDKMRRYRVAQKISQGGEQDLSVEEIADVKMLISKFYAPMVVGPAYDILDPGDK